MNYIVVFLKKTFSLFLIIFFSPASYEKLLLKDIFFIVGFNAAGSKGALTWNLHLL